MAALVLDCSVTMAWAFPDESGEAARRVLRSVGAEGAVVPAVWALEVANALLMAERRRRISAADADTFAALVAGLPIAARPSDRARELGSTFGCAREFGLSSYDASYLELAMEEGLPLATLDARLKQAARKARVRLVVR